MTNNFLKIGLLSIALLTSNVSFGGTFRMADTSQGDGEKGIKADCCDAERGASNKASNRCKEVGLPAAKRVSNWKTKEWTAAVPRFGYQPGYHEYYCEAEAEFECCLEENRS